MEKVLQHEQENIIRLKQEFQQELEISQHQAERDTIKRKLKQRHIDQWKQKPLHRYLCKTNRRRSRNRHHRNEQVA